MVEQQQRVPLWWRQHPNGSYALFVRSGLKPIEFEKGKPAIAVPSLDKLPSVIDTLITAIRNGELDHNLRRQASKQIREIQAGSVTRNTGSGFAAPPNTHPHSDGKISSLAWIFHHLRVDDGLETAVAFPTAPNMMDLPLITILGPFGGN